MHSYSPEVKLVFILCLPAKQLTLYGSVDRWIDDRQTEGWISYACNSRPTLYLCRLCSVPSDFGLHWLISGLPCSCFSLRGTRAGDWRGQREWFGNIYIPASQTAETQKSGSLSWPKVSAHLGLSPISRIFFVDSFQ